MDFVGSEEIFDLLLVGRQVKLIYLIPLSEKQILTTLGNALIIFDRQFLKLLTRLDRKNLNQIIVADHKVLLKFDHLSNLRFEVIYWIFGFQFAFVVDEECHVGRTGIDEEILFDGEHTGLFDHLTC